MALIVFMRQKTFIKGDRQRMKKRFYMIQQDQEFLDTQYYFDFAEAAQFDGITILGGRYFADYKTDEYKMIEQAFDNILDEIDRITNKSIYAEYSTVTKLFNDFIPKSDDKPYTTKQISQLKRIFKNYQNSFHIAVIELLELVTGKKHIRDVMRGCCQGDYAEIIYPADCRYNLDYLEACYFGTGTEYFCTSIESEKILKPDQIDFCELGFDTLYTTAWNTTQLKNEVKKHFCLPDDAEIIIYNIDKIRMVKKYTYALAE